MLRAFGKERAASLAILLKVFSCPALNQQEVVDDAVHRQQVYHI